MAKGRIRLLSAIPGPTSLSPIIRDFAAKPEGVVTAFSDSLLPACSAIVGEDTLVEVKAFGMIVTQVLEMCGEECLPLAQTAHCVAATAQACRDLPEHSPFYGSRRFAGLHESLWSTLKELREWGLDAGVLRDLAPSATSERLTSKLESLSAVLTQVESILYSIGRQIHGAQLASCLEGLPERDGSLDRMLVFAGSEDHPLRVEWLRWLAAGGTDITVVIDRHATTGRLFEGSVRLAEQLGVSPIPMGDGTRLARNLFTDADFGGAPIDVSIVSAADPLAETEWALRGCLKDDDPEGSALFVRNLETYAPLIEAAAKRLGVPIRLSRRAPLLTNAFARLTLTIVEFCASNDVRTLRPVLHSSYLTLSGVQQAELDSALTNAHKTRAEQWPTLERWAQENEEKFPWIVKVLAWRRDSLAMPVDLADWVGRIRNLVDVLPWHDALVNADSFSTGRDLRAQSQMVRSLVNRASIDRVSQGKEISLVQFASTCREIWEAEDVSIPSSDFGVRVASDIASLTEAKELFVLGMLEGVFPRRRSEDPILTDNERMEISMMRMGKPALLTSQDTARAERDEFYRVCAAARDRIVFSYPLTDDERDNIPAYYLDKVKEAVGNAPTQDHPRPELAPSLAECFSAADLRLREALDGPPELALPIELSTSVARSQIIPGPEEPLSPNELRDELLCPFMAVARHRLDLNPKRRLTRWYRLRRLPQSATLPTQPNEAAGESALLGALEAELEMLYSEIPEWELQLLQSGGRRLIRDWVKREFASRIQWAKDEGSIKVNVDFGDRGTRNVLPGGTLLRGTLPAVSKMDRTTFLHLYGGGPKDANDLTDPEKLYMGIHFLSAYEPGGEAAIEIEGMGGKRTLYLLNRSGTRTLNAMVQAGLEIKDLSNGEDPAQAKRIFFDEVKRLLRRAVARIQEGRIEATRGEQCENCDFGELCRRSKAFGEEDSPFGFDEGTEDV
jgi:ATP-dependent helicase/nuclease subunit B